MRARPKDDEAALPGSAAGYGQGKYCRCLIMYSDRVHSHKTDVDKGKRKREQNDKGPTSTMRRAHAINAGTRTEMEQSRHSHMGRTGAQAS